MHLKQLGMASIFILALAGCGSDPNAIDPNEQVLSLEGVPVPAIATENRDKSSDTRVSWTVQRPSSDVAAWYRKVIKKGQPFGEWDWCVESGGGSALLAAGYTYASKDRNTLLTIVVTNPLKVPGDLTGGYLENSAGIGISVSKQLSQVNCDGFTIDSKLGR